VVRNEPHGQVPLVQLHKDDFFGHVPFLDIGHEPEFASVLSSTNFKVRKVDMAAFRSEYTQLSTTFKNFVDNVGSCISVSTRVVCDYQKKYSVGK
jgi:hypothetical protein